MALYSVFRGVSMFLQVISYVVAIYCLLTWLLPPYNKIMMTLARIVDPILRPFRNLLYRIFPQMRIDLSPILLFFAIRIVETLLWRLFYLLY